MAGGGLEGRSTPRKNGKSGGRSLPGKLGGLGGRTPRGGTAQEKQGLGAEPSRNNETTTTTTASFGRTDLRRRVSEAKFDAQSDFEVREAVGPRKPDQNRENLIFRSKILAKTFFSALKTEMLGIV